MEKRLNLFTHCITFSVTFCLICYVNILDGRYKEAIDSLKRDLVSKHSYPHQRLHRRSTNEEISAILSDVETLSAFIQQEANKTVQKAIQDFLKVAKNGNSSVLIKQCPPGPPGPAGPRGERGLGMFDPEIRTRDLRIEANITENKTFKCVFFGNPIPKVTWKTHISNTKILNVIDRNNSTVTSLLQVSNITWEDRGSIECHASSLLGQANATGRLIVHSPPIMREFASNILYSYKGINFNFPPCQADGYPLPTISWKRGYGSLLRDRSSVNGNGVLEIRNVSAHDEGFYICQARNYLGEKKQTVRLNMRSLRFVTKPAIYVPVNSYPVYLNCTVYAYGGSPREIHGSWRNLNNETVHHTTTNVNNTVVLQGKIVKDGRYVCEVRNKKEKIEAVTIVEIMFLDSKLLTSQENNALGKMISGNYRLCWSSAMHGISISQFHQRCDNKGATIVLFRTPRGIIGGYTDNYWRASCGYLRSSNAFMFHIQGGRISKYTTRRTQYSTYSCRSYGPTFGGGHDLYMSASSVRFLRATNDYSLPSNTAGTFSIQAEVFYKV